VVVAIASSGSTAAIAALHAHRSAVVNAAATHPLSSAPAGWHGVNVHASSARFTAPANSMTLSLKTLQLCGAPESIVSRTPFCQFETRKVTPGLSGVQSSRVHIEWIVVAGLSQ
jgi:hypothetical protein